MYKKTLFLFRRDLRINDNIGLINALNNSEVVIPAFIFNPEQYGAKNEYFSKKSFNFMIESLEELNSALNTHNSRLFFFNGEIIEILKHLISNQQIDCIVINKDYTPFSIKRDELIAQICKTHKISFLSFDDALLKPPGSIIKSDGKPYTVFTPFWKFSSKTHPNSPISIKDLRTQLKKFYNKKIPSEIDISDFKKQHKEKLNEISVIRGGRSEAVKILKEISKFSDYESTRDFPELDKTTKLSAHLKFGTISVREAFYSISSDLTYFHPLTRQLYWRDFFYHIAYHFPKVFGNSFNEKYSKVFWDNDLKKFELWKNGITGFPIVDAGMRELNETGYMHNRVRMIVASFLTKDLHIDWRLGEKYFATKLVDYDPSLNNGNWQWAASTGCDAQPYFRIFNPWLQQRKFDENCVYIKKWIPELRHVDNELIHSWNSDKYSNHELVNSYPRPIIDHSIESKIAISRYKNI